MENPATWNEVVKIIDRAIQEHGEDVRNEVCGLSLPQTIYNKLLAEGFTISKKIR
ncbi:MAG: hypothetical protein Q8R36_04060 [bacterium]|nr:hypothetical protein [bacterium]